MKRFGFPDGLDLCSMRQSDRGGSRVHDSREDPARERSVLADQTASTEPGTTATWACQFTDWNIGNSSRIPGGYTQADNDSPLSDGKGGYLGDPAGTSVSVAGNAGISSGTLIAFTATTPAGPIWKGTMVARLPVVHHPLAFQEDAGPSTHRLHRRPR